MPDNSVSLSRYERERAARRSAERLLEEKSLELYNSNQELIALSQELEERVAERTDLLRKQTEELIKVSNARERFMANITHELRTPLQGILGFAKLGSSRVESAATEKLVKYFDTIYSSGETLLALVNNLLDLASLNSSMLEINYSRFEFKTAVTEVANELSLMAKARNLRFDVLVDYDGDIVADRFRFQQVLRNLYGNAIKFSHTDTIILVSCELNDGGFEIRVTNTGVPIPPDEAESIFDPFTESSNTRDSGGGTGLGLAICKQIIAAHNGTLWLEATDTQNCFALRIPDNLVDPATGQKAA